MKAEHDKEVLEKNRRVNDAESRIKQKEQGINQKLENLDKQAKDNDAIKENLTRQIEVVNLKRTELEKHQEEHIRRLEKIAGLTAEGSQVPAGGKPEAGSPDPGPGYTTGRSSMTRNSAPTRKPARSSYRAFSVLRPSRRSRIQLPFLILKVTRSKARSLAVKGAISGR
ncbi:Rnase Y domain-containing protein [Puia sp. P3]|uniref:Rnase Y domain-containing protein n=1 Tax=Puia sp. P3 TaxID=3423952 RepID=UPI003D664AC2